jgi:hypothetical protein
MMIKNGNAHALAFILNKSGKMSQEALDAYTAKKAAQEEGED